MDSKSETSQIVFKGLLHYSLLMIPQEGSHFHAGGFTGQSATEETYFLWAYIHLCFPVKMQNSKPNKPGSYSYENDSLG